MKSLYLAPGSRGEASFLDRIDFDGPDGCWLWIGHITEKGYGKFWMNDTMRYTHRIVYTNLVGEIPRGKTIDHICHVRDCGEITHLRLATDKQQQQNHNGPPRNNTSGFIGVSWDAAKGKWRAHIRVDGRQIFLGYFGLFEFPKAVAARKAAEEKYGWLTLSPAPQK